MTDFVEIKDWDDFQHADATKRGKDPKWIKTYTRLLSDDDYLALSGHRRAILHGLWLEYARSGRRLSLNTRSLTRRLDLRVTMADLEAIKNRGFIEFRLDNVKTPPEPDVCPEKRREEKSTASNEAALVALIPTAQTILAKFVDQARDSGVDVPSRVRGQLARNIKDLLDEDYEAKVIWAGLGRMIQRRVVIPSQLPAFVMEAQLPARNDVQRYGRGLTTEQIREMGAS